MSQQQPLLERATPAHTDLILSLRVPYPPSVNHYWRNITIKGQARTLISEAGRNYRHAVEAAVVDARATAIVGPDWRIAVYILLKMPDRRRRDLDNALKSLLDSMTHALVWRDDSQIDLLTIERGDLEPPGEAVVEIYRL